MTVDTFSAVIRIKWGEQWGAVTEAIRRERRVIIPAGG
jgi:hypothetical protein